MTGENGSVVAASSRPGVAGRRPTAVAMIWLVGALLALSIGCSGSGSVEDTRDLMETGPVETGPAPVEESHGDAFAPEFTEDGEMILPEGEIWREWPQVGTPLTPNALNGGEAPFPEFHSVYIDPVSWKHWRETGTFREGTVLAKELVTVYEVDALPDGSTRQVSGRGYFMGDFAGFEIAYKSFAHFPNEPGNWAYFSFGHHAPPYAKSTKNQPVDACNACHMASAAEDFVFTQFYPVLRAAKGRTEVTLCGDGLSC